MSTGVNDMDNFSEFLQLNSYEGGVEEKWLEKTKGVKIGVIDSFHQSKICLDDYRCFRSTPISQSVHDCNTETTLSGHGFMCASIVAGIPRQVNFFGLCEGTIKGVVPDVQLYLYATGCRRCNRDLARAIDLAIKDKVKLISMSQGLCGISHSDFDEKWAFNKDSVAQNSLNAYEKGILVCLAAGNDGPASESMLYGYPWCVNAGACTNGKNLISTVTIGTKRKMLPDDIKTFGTARDDKEIRILGTMEGTSMNIVEIPFWKLRILKDLPREKEVVLVADRQEGHVTMRIASMDYRGTCYILGTSSLPMVTLSRDCAKKIQEWRSKLGELWVCFSRSTYREDKRGVYVPEFSGRGPSRYCPEIVVPDLVARGCNIMGSHARSIPFGFTMVKEGSSYVKKRLFKDQRIITGSSLSTPYVAGLFTILLSNRPQWTLAMIKSAAITTAWSFPSNGIAGDEFGFGAGLMQLRAALNPVLVYDESDANFRKYAEGTLDVDILNLPTFTASFTDTHEDSERILRRSLTNIDNTVVVYFGRIEIFNNTLDKHAKIHVVPSCLRFSPLRNKRDFVVDVKLCPWPSGQISGLLIWEDKYSNHTVTSPIHFYHKSGFERCQWYDERTPKERKMDEEARNAEKKMDEEARNAEKKKMDEEARNAEKKKMDEEAKEKKMDEEATTADVKDKGKRKIVEEKTIEEKKPKKLLLGGMK